MFCVIKFQNKHLIISASGKGLLAGMKNNDSMMQLHVYPLGHLNMMHDSKLFSIYFTIEEIKALSFSNIIDFIQW